MMDSEERMLQLADEMTQALEIFLRGAVARRMEEAEKLRNDLHGFEDDDLVDEDVFYYNYIKWGQLRQAQASVIAYKILRGLI